MKKSNDILLAMQATIARFLLAAVLVSSTALGANVTFSVKDMALTPVLGQNVKLIPSTITATSTNIFSDRARSWALDANGMVVISNLQAGLYYLLLSGVTTNSGQWLNVPAGDTNVAAGLILTNFVIIPSGSDSVYFSTTGYGLTNYVDYSTGKKKVEVTATAGLGDVTTPQLNSVSNYLKTNITDTSFVSSSNLTINSSNGLQNNIVAYYVLGTEYTDSSSAGILDSAIAFSMASSNTLYSQASSLSQTSSNAANAYSLSIVILATNGITSNTLLIVTNFSVVASNDTYAASNALRLALSSVSASLTNFGRSTGLDSTNYANIVAGSSSNSSKAYSDLQLATGTNAQWLSFIQSSNWIASDYVARFVNTSNGLLLQIGTTAQSASNSAIGFTTNATNAIWVSVISGPSNALYNIFTNGLSNSVYWVNSGAVSNSSGHATNLTLHGTTTADSMNVTNVSDGTARGLQIFPVGKLTLISGDEDNGMPIFPVYVSNALHTPTIWTDFLALGGSNSFIQAGSGLDNRNLEIRSRLDGQLLLAGNTVYVEGGTTFRDGATFEGGISIFGSLSVVTGQVVSAKNMTVTNDIKALGTFIGNGVGLSNVVVPGVQLGSVNLTNWSLYPTSTFNGLQLGSVNLTNWSLYPTSIFNGLQLGSVNLSNWSSYPTGIVNLYTGVTAGYQFGSTNTSNWANIPTNILATFSLASDTSSRQAGSANLTNWSLYPTSIISSLASTGFVNSATQTGTNAANGYTDSKLATGTNNLWLAVISCSNSLVNTSIVFFAAAEDFSRAVSNYCLSYTDTRLGGATNALNTNIINATGAVWTATTNLTGTQFLVLSNKSITSATAATNSFKIETTNIVNAIVNPYTVTVSNQSAINYSTNFVVDFAAGLGERCVTAVNLVNFVHATNIPAAGGTRYLTIMIDANGTNGVVSFPASFQLKGGTTNNFPISNSVAILGLKAFVHNGITNVLCGFVP